MKAHLEFKGIDQLIKHMQKNVSLEDVKKVVKKNGADLTKVMQEKAQFKGHFEGDVFVAPTGFTRRSIRMWIHDGGMTAQVGPQSYYSPYLEYGTRFMSSQPFVNPAFNYQKLIFIKEMKRLVK